MKILIVDDIKANLELLEARLEGSGYEVASARNGAEALESLKRDSIDMIISDILMPKMDGYQLCRECKRDDTLRNIPFVFYTANYTNKKDEEFALSLGAERFIVKPMEHKRFMETIEDTLKNHKKGLMPSPEMPVEKEEADFLKEHSERLIKKLDQKVFQLEETERTLQNRTYDLKERVKELDCLYSISKLAEEEGISLEKITQGVVNLIPPAWQYPEITCARAILEGQEFRTGNFKETVWKQASDIKVHGKWIGTVEVYYLEEKPEIDEGPFLKEEKALIIDIAERLGRIIERKRAEELLRESEEKFRELFDGSTDAIFIANPETRKLVDCNKQAQKITGYSREEILSMRADQLHPKDKVKKTMEGFKKHVAGEFLFVESEVLTKDKKRVPVSISYSLLEIASEKYLQCIFRDITESKQAEQKIQEYSQNLERMVEERTKELNRALYDTEAARDRIDGILKSIGDGLIVTDMYNRIILMNLAAEDLLRVRFSEAIDRSIDFTIKDKTLRDRIKTTLDKKKGGYEFDFELPGEDTKHPRIMRARTSVIDDKTGKHTGSITIIHDVSYEREVDRMKTEFLSTVAHELRTPLTSIQGFSEILLTRDGIKEEEKEECLSYINKQSVNLATLINDLLDISRIESGKVFTLNKTPCNIADIIKYTIPYFQTLSPKHSFEVVLPEESVELMVDKEKMGQVLENLLSNAVKYSPEGGSISVSAKRIEELEGDEKQSAIEISVADTGMGMSPEQVEKIFDKFYRADASNTAIPGTGLGMNIVQCIVETHGGKVWVGSELGKGTTVKFTIPTK